MSTAPPLRDVLVDKAIAAVAGNGFENISLRAITNAAGCSTAAVFQYFGSKAGLINAAMKTALQADLSFHNHFAESTQGLVLHHQSFANQLAFYIEQRAESATARFLSEILFKSAQIPESGQYLRSWHDMRTAFWAARLKESTGNPALAPLLAAYCVVEEVYSYSLNNQLEYNLMLRETAYAITAKSFAEHGNSYDSEISEWLDKSAQRFEITATADRNALSKGLLDQAAKHIINYGVDSLTQRKITKLAGTSSAMIAYHFGNLDSFVNEAIWRALAVDIPNEVHPYIKRGRKQTTITEWSKLLANFIEPARENKQGSTGFFINVARIIGQTSLLAVHRKELRPIIDHMRKFEGRGSYTASKTIWPPEIKINRATAASFAMWIKGQAILNEAFADQLQSNDSHLLSAAALLFPSTVQ